MKKYLFIITLLTITFSINAQIIPDTLWTKTFGGLSTDIGVSMQQAFDNGFILTGNTSSFGSGCTDIWLIKTDEFGNEEWSQTFGQEEYDGAFSVQQTIDGGYVITGYSFVSIEDQTDSWLIKTDESGNEEWSQTFGGNADDQMYCVQQTSDNGFILTGSTRSYGSGSSDAWLIKTDENGNEEWSQIFGGLGSDLAHSVQQTIDGGYVLTGYTDTFPASYSDAWLIKTDEFGIEEWSQTFDTGSDEESRSVRQTNDGGFIIAGCTDKFSYFESDILILKTDVNGDEEWRKIYGAAGVDRANSILQISENDFVVLGFTNSTGLADFWFLRLGLETNINSNSIPDDKLFINNFPNPFNPTTTISFSLNTENTENTELVIYNIKGQKIRQYSIFNSQSVSAGLKSSITWNGTDENNQPVSSGIYFYKLKVNGKYKAVKKCLLLK